RRLAPSATHELLRCRTVRCDDPWASMRPAHFLMFTFSLRGMGRGRGNGADPVLGKGYLVGVHVVLDRHRRPVADDLDEVVGSGEDPVLVVDGDIAEVLDEVR